MSDYIKHKDYKLPNGRTVTADFNELGHATITIQAMDALFDILNSSDVVEAEKVNKIYKKLADLFDTPCNFSPCDEIMLESERCREDCGNISDAECWKRYFEVVCDTDMRGEK